jgi:hypothetical protein
VSHPGGLAVHGAVNHIVAPGRLIGALGFNFSRGVITEIDMISDPVGLRASVSVPASGAGGRR